MLTLADFTPTGSMTTFGAAADGSTAYHTRTSNNNGWFHAPLGLPPNSRLHEICIFAYDNSSATELGMVVAFTELGDATRPAIAGGRLDTTILTGVAATPGYVRLCRNPVPEIVLSMQGDPSGDGVPGWLTWTVQVVPGLATGTWPQIGWAGVALRWSPPIN
jgi:hypothetical protein